jgi:transcriptional repressor NrdR
MCGNPKSIVLETRSTDDALTLRRRRECSSCSHRFSTSETVVDNLSVVISQDGRRSPFSRKQLADSLMLAGRHSLPESDRERVVEEVTSRLRHRGPAVTSAEIAAAALAILSEMDWQSWLRYALNTMELASVSEYVQWVSSHTPRVGQADSRAPQALVRKSNGTIEDFSGFKLLRAIQHASQSRQLDPSIINDTIQSLAARVEQAFRERQEPIPTSEIGAWVEEALAEVSPLVALSFSIQFRAVDSAEALMDAASRIQSLADSPRHRGSVA